MTLPFWAAFLITFASFWLHPFFTVKNSLELHCTSSNSFFTGFSLCINRKANFVHNGIEIQYGRKEGLCIFIEQLNKLSLRQSIRPKLFWSPEQGRTLKFNWLRLVCFTFKTKNCIDRTRFFWVRNGDFGYVCRMQIYLYPHITAIRSRIPWVLFKIPCTPYLMAWCSLSPISVVVSPKLFQEASSFLHPAPCQSNSWNK